MNSSNVLSATDASFQQDVLESELPVLVDFWAPWCGPCKMMAPVLEDVAGEYNGRVKIVKLNADENPQTASRLGVRGLPTLMLFKQGTVEAQRVGAAARAQLSAFLDTHL